MKGHAVNSVEMSCEFAGRTIPAPKLVGKTGGLAPTCAHIVLKSLYLARIARRDLLRTFTMVALSVTKWNQALLVEMLMRLISYINHTKHHRQYVVLLDRTFRTANYFRTHFRCRCERFQINFRRTWTTKMWSDFLDVQKATSRVSQQCRINHEAVRFGDVEKTQQRMISRVQRSAREWTQ